MHGGVHTHSKGRGSVDDAADVWGYECHRDSPQRRGRNKYALGDLYHDYIRRQAYATWLRFFYEGEGIWRRYVVEALLAYWFSWFVLPSGSENGLHSYVFLLVVVLTN